MRGTVSLDEAGRPLRPPQRDLRRHGAGGLRTFTSRSRAVPQGTLPRDFDYLEPTLDVKAEATAWDESAAVQMHYGEHDFRAESPGIPTTNDYHVTVEAIDARVQWRASAGVKIDLSNLVLANKDVNIRNVAAALRYRGTEAGQAGVQSALNGLTCFT